MCQAASWLSLLCSYSGRNQLKKGEEKVQKSKAAENRTRYPWCYTTSVPQRLSSNAHLVQVPGCRNNPTTEHSHHFHQQLLPQRSRCQNLPSVSWFHSEAHLASSNRIWVLKDVNGPLFLVFSVFRNTLNSHCGGQGWLTPCSASCFTLFSNTTGRLLSLAHGYPPQRGSVCSRHGTFIGNQLEELNFRNRICVQSVQQEIQLTFGHSVLS